MRKKEVMKHSAAVQISNKMTLVQYKSWNVLLANAFDDFSKKDIFKISVSTLKAYIEYKFHDNAYLKECIEAISDIKVRWNIFGKDKQNKWGVIHLLAEAEIENGILKYSFGPMLKKKLQDPNMYVRINLLVQNEFTSVQSLSLFELILDYYDVQRECGETPWIDLEIMREFFGIEEHEYPEFKHFNAYVIQKTIKEVIKVSGLSVKSKLKRIGRKVGFVKFIANKNPKKKNILDKVPTENDIQNIKEELRKIGKTIPPTSTTKPRQTPIPETTKDSSLASLLQLIPEDQRRFITTSRLIIASYKRYGYEYTKACAIYAAERSKGGYCGYLGKTITNNYARYEAQPKPKQTPKQSSPKPKPEKWPIVEYLGQIVDLSIFQKNGGHNTIVAFDEETDVLTAFHLYAIYKKRDPKVKVIGKMLNSMPQVEKLPTVKYNGYTVDLEKHRYIIGNGLIVVGKDVKGRDLNYASLLRLYRKGEVEIVGGENEDNHTEEMDETALA